ncbi:hypothetical protein [Amycolatopsis suaedae]|uniref:Uncharacterized protein n=1 Tax=Amycolatopsis suaedae TaxID=2510978 RepID=A0A4Q7JCG0_9PSEU|nr:hypothetical protein [Amycolatopsis suaedae]RZQ64736.1 hypothetical protein EWH70_07565 [Amycolatopsis suaedae]
MRRHLPSRLGAGALIALSAAGLNAGLAGAGPAPEEPPGQNWSVPVAALLDYRCTGTDPAVTYPVTLGITTTVPAWVAQGQSVELGAPDTAVTLPPEVRPLLGSPAAMSGRVAFELVAEQGGARRPSAIDIGYEKMSVPETGSPLLSGKATIPPIPTSGPAQLRLTVSPPTVTLVPEPADGAPPLDPAPTPTVLTCSPAEELNPVLATVAVVPPGAVPPAPPSQTAPGARQEQAEQPGVTAGAQAAAVPNLLFAPPETLSGTSTVLKIKTKIALGPGFIPYVSVFSQGADNTLYTEAAVPPARSPFLAFDFVPTNGTAEFRPADDSGSTLTAGTGILKAGRLEVMRLENVIRLSDVTINGVPYDVGPNCRTETPVKIAIASDPRTNWTPTNGGPLQTMPDSPVPEVRGFTIPPFVDCGVTERIDALVTGLISGPGNQLNLNLPAIKLKP